MSQPPRSLLAGAGLLHSCLPQLKSIQGFCEGPLRNGGVLKEEMYGRAAKGAVMSKHGPVRHERVAARAAIFDTTTYYDVPGTLNYSYIRKTWGPHTTMTPLSSLCRGHHSLSR